MPGMAPNCSIPPHAVPQSACDPAMGKMNLVYGLLEGINQQPPLILQERGFWQNIQEPRMYWTKQSLTARHKALHVGLNRMNKK